MWTKNPKSVIFAGVVLAAATPSACFGQIAGAGEARTGAHRSPMNTDTAYLDQEYKLQPGDTVSVSFRFTPEFNEEAVIGPDGSVALKSVGAVKAAGQTIERLRTEITEDAKSKLVNPEVAVTVKDFDRPHVFIAGEVNAPGRQDLRHPTTVIQAILMCGGAKDDAALSRVLLLRRIDSETAEVHVLRLAHYDRKSRGENDMLLEPGDMVLVRRDLPSRFERYVKIANLGFYLNPLQNVTMF